MSQQINLGAMMGIARRDLRRAVGDVFKKTGLPAYVIGSILDGIRAEIASDEIIDLINSFTTESEVKPDDNTTEQN